MNKNFKDRLPWIVSFSFSRAIQQPALEKWKGQDANVVEAQKILLQNAKNNAAARLGKYNLK
jgi:fructose-bisphosphate aldolase class I